MLDVDILTNLILVTINDCAQYKGNTLIANYLIYETWKCVRHSWYSLFSWYWLGSLLLLCANAWGHVFL